MRLRFSVQLVAALVAAGGTQPGDARAEPPAAASTLPPASPAAGLPARLAGWWIVDAENGLDMGTPGAAWRFGEVLVIVDAQHAAARRTPLTCKALNDHAFHCVRSLREGPHYLHLVLRDDGQLVATAGKEGETPYGQMNARRAQAAEIPALAAVEAAGVARDAEACGLAKRCYAVACPAFGDPADPCIFEKHSLSTDRASCRAMIPALVTTLERLDKAIPRECQPAK